MKRLLSSPTLQVTLVLFTTLAAVAAVFSTPWAPDWAFPLAAGAGCIAAVAVGVRSDLKRSERVEEGGLVEKLSRYPLVRGTLMLALPIEDVMIVNSEPQIVLIPLEKILALLPPQPASQQLPRKRELTGESIAKALGA